jgi:hypothetical protein
MPFTISHAAAAWPFEKSKLVLSAVIVGAMAPDFDYFLNMGITGRWTHTIAGTFEFSLPAALIVLAVFHLLLKKSAVALLPERVQRRIVIEQFRFWPLGRFLLIVGSALAGIATHLLWDSFTHGQGWMVDRIRWLQTSHVLWGHLWPNYKFAQHGSTVVGLMLLALWFRGWYRSTEPVHPVEPRLSVRVRTAVICSILATAFGVGLVRAWTLAGPHPFKVTFVATDVVSFVSVTTLGLLVFSLALLAWEE